MDRLPSSGIAQWFTWCVIDVLMLLLLVVDVVGVQLEEEMLLSSSEVLVAAVECAKAVDRN